MTDETKGPYQRAAEREGWMWDGDGPDEVPAFVNDDMAVRSTHWAEPTEDEWRAFCNDRHIPVVRRHEPGTPAQGDDLSDRVREDIEAVTVRGGEAMTDETTASKTVYALDLTARDWFAGMAQAGSNAAGWPLADVAKWCYQFADAMLAERAKGTEDEG